MIKIIIFIYINVVYHLMLISGQIPTYTPKIT